jgi:hypothetical protein
MAAKVTERVWEIGDIVEVLEAWENQTRGHDVAQVEIGRPEAATRQ